MVDDARKAAIADADNPDWAHPSGAGPLISLGTTPKVYSRSGPNVIVRGDQVL
jgi:hypothetical protein